MLLILADDGLTTRIHCPAVQGSPALPYFEEAKIGPRGSFLLESLVSPSVWIRKKTALAGGGEMKKKF